MGKFPHLNLLATKAARAKMMKNVLMTLNTRVHLPLFEVKVVLPILLCGFPESRYIISTQILLIFNRQSC